MRIVKGGHPNLIPNASPKGERQKDKLVNKYINSLFITRNYCHTSQID